jgi:hypothetical protein
MRAIAIFAVVLVLASPAVSQQRAVPDRESFVVVSTASCVASLRAKLGMSNLGADAAKFCACTASATWDAMTPSDMVALQSGTMSAELARRIEPQAARCLASAAMPNTVP